jgi:hypothetical protein
MLHDPRWDVSGWEVSGRGLRQIVVPWASTNNAEYVALTQLQADAFVTLDETGAQRQRDRRDRVD